MRGIVPSVDTSFLHRCSLFLYDRMAFLLNRLPAEQWREAARSMGAGAGIKDWMKLEEVCCRGNVELEALFGGWLDSQKAGEGFAEFWNGEQDEVEFLRRHAGGERGCCLWRDGTLTRGSVRETRRVGGVRAESEWEAEMVVV